MGGGFEFVGVEIGVGCAVGGRFVVRDVVVEGSVGVGVVVAREDASVEVADGVAEGETPVGAAFYRFKRFFEAQGDC